MDTDSCGLFPKAAAQSQGPSLPPEVQSPVGQPPPGSVHRARASCRAPAFTPFPQRFARFRVGKPRFVRSTNMPGLWRSGLYLV